MMISIASHSGIGQRRQRRAVEGGARVGLQKRQHLFLVGDADVHFQAGHPFRGHRPLEHQNDVVHLLLFPGVGTGFLIGDEARRAGQQLGDDAQIVRLQGAAGLGDINDGVGEARRLHLGRAPAELDLGADAVLREIALRDADQLRGDAFALQVVHGHDRRIVRHREHPAHRPAADLREDQLRELRHLRFVFQHPVVAGEAAIERAVLRHSAAFPGRG